jgi:hypothetical protein
MLLTMIVIMIQFNSCINVFANRKKRTTGQNENKPKLNTYNQSKHFPVSRKCPQGDVKRKYLKV